MNATPWFRSPVAVGILVSLVTLMTLLFPRVAVILGLVDPASIQTFVESLLGNVGTIMAAIGVLANLVALVKRVRSQIQPLTLTQKGADSHPVTVANVKATAYAVALEKASQDMRARHP